MRRRRKKRKTKQRNETASGTVTSALHECSELISCRCCARLLLQYHARCCAELRQPGTAFTRSAAFFVCVLTATVSPLLVRSSSLTHFAPSPFHPSDELLTFSRSRQRRSGALAAAATATAAARRGGREGKRRGQTRSSKRICCRCFHSSPVDSAALSHGWPAFDLRLSRPLVSPP